MWAPKGQFLFNRKGESVNTETKEVEEQTLIVGIPVTDAGFEKISYVNTRGAALNYVRAESHNREEAHCADRAD